MDDKQVVKNNIDEATPRIQLALVDHVYSQAALALVASLFCASVVFIGLLSMGRDNFSLYIWGGFFSLITLLRYGLYLAYQKQKTHLRIKDVKFWNNLYVAGSTLGGLSWGLAAILLIPGSTPLEINFIILMLAGVTGGAVPISSSVPAAAISFMLASLIPFIAVLLTLGERLYLLFDAALVIYLLYSIKVILNSYRMIKKNIVLRFENNYLIQDLIDAKKELEGTNKRLNHLATHDVLTNVANRTLFQSHLLEATHKAVEKDTNLALLFIDLDQFKLVNNTYGHTMGDKLLVKMVNKISEYFAKDEFFMARLGGDQITILVENRSIEDIKTIAKRITAILTESVLIDRISIRISASIGVSIYPIDARNADDLMKYADRAMHCVKEKGGNNYALYSELNSATMESQS